MTNVLVMCRYRHGNVHCAVEHNRRPKQAQKADHAHANIQINQKASLGSLAMLNSTVSDRPRLFESRIEDAYQPQIRLSHAVKANGIERLVV